MIVCAGCWLAYAHYGVSSIRPPLILISIDTLRADHLAVYSYKRNRTPAIDSFAENGTVFTSIDSQVPLTLPSHTVLFTSTYPFENRVEENAEIVPQGLVTLASVLRKSGYETGAFIGSSLLSKRYGLDKGFEVYDDPFHWTGEDNANPYDLRVRRDGALVTRAALSWLTAKHNAPVFAFVHIYDVHTPYAVRQYSGERVIPNTAGYDAEIGYVDQILGHFEDSLKKCGIWQRSVVVLLGDHGESLGEHGETSHGYFVYESTLHVPLIVHWPDADRTHPRRVDDPGGLIDVAPTLLAYLHVPPPPSFEGTDLLVNGKRQVYSETAYARDSFRWAMLRTVREGNLDYIDAPQAELYDLASDPGEHHNLLHVEPQRAAVLKRDLTTLMARYGNSHAQAAKDMSAQSTAALRSLGYLAGGGDAVATDSGPDEKERLPEYQEYEKALGHLYMHSPGSAISGFRRVLGMDPANTLARYYLGDAYLRAGNLNSALGTWQAAFDRDHTFEPALVAIGRVYLLKHEFEKAKDTFERAALLAPSDYEAQFQLGTVDEQLGLKDEAVRHISVACRISGDDDAVCRNILARLRRSSDKPEKN